MNFVELLAPARDLQSAVAAVDYGADAVYIGGAKFGARHAAGNSAEQIARVAEYAHRYGVRVHATLNTLIYDDELETAERQARELIAAGVDALIVQDMALRRMDLPVELHASTQVCNMTPEQARFLGECGFARVILERALSLDEIRAICAATNAEVECFVHGAICVGYSGRCFLSRSMSERSGNRGACSQPCRLTYDLTDGSGRTYLAGKHLLSVRDLNLSAHVGELLDAGVRSLKIEGRLKDINYIRNTVAYYRRAVDDALTVRPHLRRASAGESVADFTPDTAKSFTRGESEYFFAGKRAGVASFDTPKAVGEYAGCVTRVERTRFRLDRAHTLAARRRHLLPDAARTGRNQRQCRRRRLRDTQPHGRDRSGMRGLPQLRPPLQPAARTEPYAARDSGRGRGDGVGGGGDVPLYRLRRGGGCRRTPRCVGAGE